MKELTQYIVNSITSTDKFKVEEVIEDSKVTIIISIDQEFIGLVIGKGGKTIAAIRNILKIKGIKEKKAVFVDVRELQLS